MKTRILIALMLAAGVILSSCTSTKEAPEGKPNMVAIHESNQKVDKKLTDAEKKALIEADLWLPGNQKPSATK